MQLQNLSLGSYFKAMLDKFLELNVTLTVVSVLIAVLMVVILAFINKKTGGLKWDTRKLTYGSVCIALSFILSYIRLWKMPNGGSVTAASMLPMLAYGYMAGPLWGMITGLAYSVLQFLQESYFLSLPQFLFDYIFPFVAISTLSGVFRTKNKALNLYLGFALAILVRYLCHVFAGIAFWAESAPYNPVLYSFAYNSFVFIDALPCFILIAIPKIQGLFKRLPKK